MINPRKLFSLIAPATKEFSFNNLVERMTYTFNLSHNNIVYSIQHRTIDDKDKFVVLKFIDVISEKNLHSFTKYGFVLGIIDDTLSFDNVFDILEIDEIKKTFDL